MKRLFSEIPYLEGGHLVLRKLVPSDEEALRELVESPAVYRYLPDFLFEKKYPDAGEVIRRLYTCCSRGRRGLGLR
ncbi:MAG: hypothetical protein K6D56_00785 [Clostridia bacterium]|nr:hypothetical protein [Clostridia bacterium]